MTKAESITTAKKFLALPLEEQQGMAKKASMPFEMWKELLENQAKGITTVFDLPMKRQLELVERHGFDNYDDWAKEQKERMKKTREHSKTFQWGVRPDGWTDEDAKRFQDKIDSTHQ